MINNHYKESKEILEDQESIINEESLSKVFLKVKIHSDKGTKKINSLIISKNTLLIETSDTINRVDRVDILSLKKSFYNKTEINQDGFVSIIEEKLLLISFFMNLFEYYLGLEKK